MITWMQRHKKWLVITIWISTIAFVGAGFVGWGSYDYGSKGGVVATVGNKEISVEEYQQEYSNLYNQYSQIFGASFNKELAEQLRLKDVAFSQLNCSASNVRTPRQTSVQPRFCCASWRVCLVFITVLTG